MLVILIIGIAILGASGLMPSRKSSDGSAPTTVDFAGEEERLGDILSQIEGAGRISVMISYESTPEKELAGEDGGRTMLYGGDAVVKREVYPVVKGVIIVADGAYDAQIKRALMEAAAAVTGAGANRICVYPMKSN